MSDSSISGTNSEAERFYGRALTRIRRFLLILGFLGSLICLLRFGPVLAFGFLLGSFISYTNHVWLEGMVNTLGERITSGQSRERGSVIVIRAVLRYASIALGAYVIFKVSLPALYGFLAGVCLTIAAVCLEAIVEIYMGLRRGL